jgi:hypothetical protein
MNENWDDAVSRAIQEAMERGEFDNLPGRGQRQHFDASEMADPSAMANRVLKNAGVGPPWADLQREIEEGVRRAEEDIERTYRWRRAALSQPSANRALVEQEWQRALRLLRDRCNELNKKILTFNLVVPSQLPHLHKRRLKVEAVLEKLER